MPKAEVIIKHDIPVSLIHMIIMTEDAFNDMIDVKEFVSNRELIDKTYIIFDKTNKFSLSNNMENAIKYINN